MSPKETILTRLGIAEALGHRAKAAAGRIQHAAAKLHDGHQAELDQLRRQIEAAGVGDDAAAEERYCQLLVERMHMAQAHTLSGQDAERMPEVSHPLAKGRRPPPSGMASLFDEEAHPREAKGAGGDKYKPGEFVPKGDSEGTGHPQAWETPRSDMYRAEDLDKEYTANYFDENGDRIANSRTTPAREDDLPVGSWRIGDWKGVHGRDVDQLRELDPNDPNIIPGEDTEPAKLADVDRYAEWARQGMKAPPIEAVQLDNGKIKIANGHRRWLAAKQAGTKLRAWVSPPAVIPRVFDSEGQPQTTNLTHELAIHHAIEAGHRVPDEVLQDYPELKERHQRVRKETARQTEEGGQAKASPPARGDAKANSTRSAAFKAWFGDSQVTDAQGRPLVVYHGTNQRFSTFDPAELGSGTGHPTAPLGFYFTADRPTADRYATIGGRTLPVYLRISNPYRMEKEEWLRLFLRKGVQRPREQIAANIRRTRARLAAEGYDGIYMPADPTSKDYEMDYAHDAYVAFESEQIKSVKNAGTFDPNDPNMFKARGCPSFVPPDMPPWPGARRPAGSFLPLNQVEDRDKMRAMRAAMRAGTWTWDVPLVRCGDQLLSGSHRYAAANQARLPLQTIPVDDVFREAGLDFKTTWEQCQQPYDGWRSNMDYALQCLPPDLLRKYGLDLG